MELLNEFIPFRVYAVLDNYNKSLSELSTTSVSYCLPETEILISQTGLENPDCSILMLKRLEPMRLRCNCVFVYDGGNYIGVYGGISKFSGPRKLRHLELYRIYNISTF